ncbi:MAG: tRNA uridine-5-carboxymethylaminomethyl(34) synthesis GTPase MnmE [Gammaproteobacteria bacterium]|nr:tRNA uridine-5-carboxymethylaminomethyl(34) synthesis GTPase MnmE [Gammaproteobacteria bacterium]MDH5613899.1 tRNA uridine-5-carboxymethylaminomethyl(34) synthesis GTPase MnmE [Gammaproteobacteria bacterium]
MNNTKDTIAAIATPPGQGGVGIVRVSGSKAKDIALAITGQTPQPRYAHFVHFKNKDNEVIDTGLAIYFPGPHSFTGEDVLELQGHGGPVIMDMLLQRVLELGVRGARPGEFSERAFLNDKIDLAQAEAIADLIESGTEQAARAAQRSLEGVFSTQIHALVDELIGLRTYVEAAIDFPEEEIDFLSDKKVSTHLQEITEKSTNLLDVAKQGCLLRDGIKIVIAGPPNAGKSSLLNVLAGRESAIVTEIPGTTRDVLREQIQIDGIPLHIVDTAGLRETGDIVEKEGIKRAWDEIVKSDIVLLVLDSGVETKEMEKHFFEQLPEKTKTIIVHNKIDITQKQAQIKKDKQTNIWLSVKTGDGIKILKEHLKETMGYSNAGTGVFSARRRHLDALQRAQDAIAKGKQQLEKNKAGELLAEELRQAQQALSEITGEFTSDDLLGEIFSSFCIGK